jgi:hypothetical protein
MIGVFNCATEPMKLLQKDYFRLADVQKAGWLQIYLMTWEKPAFSSIGIYRFYRTLWQIG